MTSSPVEICYLCGQPTLSDRTRDHVLQQLFIQRKDPKSTGFKYGHYLWVHKACNAHFGNKGQGAESECRDALQRIHDLNNEIMAGQRKDAWLYPRDSSGKISGPFVTDALEVGMRYYAQEVEKGNWYFAFTHNGMSVLFYFEFTRDANTFKQMKSELQPQPSLLFESARLVDLVDTTGSQMKYELLSLIPAYLSCLKAQLESLPGFNAA